MSIGIIGAMDEEVVILLEKMSEVKTVTVANCVFHTGKLRGHDVVLLKSGIGKVNAALATTILNERFNPEYIINTGSAGGYSDELEVGDIVISTEVVHHDVDATIFDYQYGQVPGMPVAYPADKSLIERASAAIKRLDVSSVQGVIATGDSFMNDPERVNVVLEKLDGVVAMEMEAAAVAQVCYQYNKPFVIIRALSDIAGKESSISFDSFLTKAAQNASDLIVELLSPSFDL